MAELVAVGDRTFVTALVGVGAEPRPCETTEKFQQALKQLALRKDVRLVFLSEPQAATAPAAVQTFRKRSNAALVTLPLTPSEDHPTLQEVRYLVEQATGASLI